MKPLEAPPPEGEKEQKEEDVQMTEEEEQPPTAALDSSAAQPVSPEILWTTKRVREDRRHRRRHGQTPVFRTILHQRE